MHEHIVPAGGRALRTTAAPDEADRVACPWCDHKQAYEAAVVGTLGNLTYFHCQACEGSFVGWRAEPAH